MTYPEFIEIKHTWIETHNQGPNLLIVGESIYPELVKMAQDFTKDPMIELYMIDGVLLITDPEYIDRFTFSFDSKLESNLTIKNKSWRI